MKTMRILAMVLGIFLTVSVNVALAQDESRNDSIYGLEVSKENMNITFYSTYDMNNATRIFIFSYDKTTNTRLFADYFSRKDSVSFEIASIGVVLFYEKTTEDIYKINKSPNDFSMLGFLNYILIPEDKPTKIELYIEGEGFAPPSDNLRSGIVGRSNVLTFFFDPLMETTSLNETLIGKNYVYKYFFLSGLESKTKPVGVPFIQATYNNGVLISTDKFFLGNNR